jgi:6-pyruvoyltetrahydropterin/6-carboxytetrahydropterin synthase
LQSPRKGGSEIMFEIEKTFTFEAAHELKHHDGKCKNMHGHSYILQIAVRKADLIPSGPKVNMVMDFQDVNDVVKPLIEEYLDHRILNETLQSDSTTVEFVCKWIFERLESKIEGLHRITLYETATSKATYWNEPYHH